MITRFQLFKLYKQLDIQRKVTTFDRLLTPAEDARIGAFLAKVKEKVRNAVGGPREIVYIDEVVFTRRTYPTHAYSSPRRNIVIDKKKIN